MTTWKKIMTIMTSKIKKHIKNPIQKDSKEDSKKDTVYKPWGHYADIYRTHEVVFKKIIIKPGEELSYQSHEKRDEFWFIKTGAGSLTVCSIDIKVSAGESFQIYRNNKHMIKNIGERDLEIYEMQCGCCDEDDIIRHSDKYGRA